MKSELIEMRDNLGWMEPTVNNIPKVIEAIMECLTEIDYIRSQINNLGEILERIENGK